MIISFGGTPGAGKSTAAKMLAKELGFPRYYVGQMIRDIAKKHNMTLDEFFKVAKEDSKYDLEVDNYQKDLGEREDNFVIEGRTSFYFIPHSFKIYLDVDLKKAAERIFNDLKKNPDRNEAHFSVDDTYIKLKQREETDKIRYQKLYGFDYTDKSNYDLVVDTTDLTPEQVHEKVMAKVRKKLE